MTLKDVSYIFGLPVNGEPITGRSDSSHQFLVENCITCFGQESGPQDHVLSKVSIPWVRRCRDTEPCDTQEFIERYVRAHIFYVLGTVVFPNKSTTSLNSKFLLLLRDFHRISAYIYMAAIYGSGGSGCPRSPLGYLLHPVTASVIRVHRMAPDRPRAQNHDWGEIYSQWVNKWRFDRYNTLQLGEEIIDFHPLPVYYEWYTQQYGMHLRLSDRVAGEEVGADEPQQQQEEPANPQEQQQAPYIPEPQPPQAPEPYIPQLVIPAEDHFSPLGGSDTISFSQVLRDTDFLFSTPPQEGPATSQHSGGRRATSGHASDFDFDQLTEGDLGYDLQHWYDLGGASALGMSGSSFYDTSGASMTNFDGPNVGSGLDAGVSQGRSYNLRTQTVPPNKYTPSLYSKKAPRK
ncbi:hypothetical protein Ahy_A03g011573 [Arachis hypogaea]|uniref:Aminotransferase-like plant mobile domain-containing protein n=1 Tax=Arachis hypogaea TaxID=3818 RepID=A0A445DR32_ARAHY|nr:hypothetical protein Ahy_A03g011573 [Arachis hypogaea]